MERLGNNSDEPPLGAALHGEVEHALESYAYGPARTPRERAADLGGMMLAAVSEVEDQKVVIEESAIDRIKRLQAEADLELHRIFGEHWTPYLERDNEEGHVVGLGNKKLVS
jgi:hypothetical protein